MRHPRLYVWKINYCCISPWYDSWAMLCLCRIFVFFSRQIHPRASSSSWSTWAGTPNQAASRWCQTVSLHFRVDPSQLPPPPSPVFHVSGFTFNAPFWVFQSVEVPLPSPVVRKSSVPNQSQSAVTYSDMYLFLSNNFTPQHLPAICSPLSGTSHASSSSSVSLEPLYSVPVRMCLTLQLPAGFQT